MKLMILGADGMLGYQAVQYFKRRYEVIGTVRKTESQLADYLAFKEIDSYYQIDARNFSAIEKLFEAQKPDVVINCIGIVKQRSLAKEAIESIELNALFPHRLAALCAESGARVMHYSTDCVFSGKKGSYEEQDFPDALDLYGRTKLLGELDYPHCFTFRTSIIGLELFHKKSLVEWYLAQSGKVKGFSNAIYTGFTTLEMCRITESVMKNQDLYGVFQVASEPISKFDLLSLLRGQLGAGSEIVEDVEFCCDRSLIGSRFNQAAGYSPPSWKAMVTELAEQIRGRQ